VQLVYKQHKENKGLFVVVQDAIKEIIKEFERLTKIKE